MKYPLIKNAAVEHPIMVMTHLSWLRWIRTRSWHLLVFCTYIVHWYKYLPSNFLYSISFNQSRYFVFSAYINCLFICFCFAGFLIPGYLCWSCCCLQLIDTPTLCNSFVRSFVRSYKSKKIHSGRSVFNQLIVSSSRSSRPGIPLGDLQISQSLMIWLM